MSRAYCVRALRQEPDVWLERALDQLDHLRGAGECRDLRLLKHTVDADDMRAVLAAGASREQIEDALV